MSGVPDFDLLVQVRLRDSPPIGWADHGDHSEMEIVELFVAHGTDPSARNKAGNTAADWPRKREMLEVAKRLEGAASEANQ